MCMACFGDHFEESVNTYKAHRVPIEAGHVWVRVNGK